MTFSIRPWVTAALVGAVAVLVQGCGKGLFDRASVVADSATGDDGDVDGSILPPRDDAGVPPEDGPRPVNDGPKPSDDGPKLNDDGPKVVDAKSPLEDVGKPTEEVTQVFDTNGGPLTLGPATLTIGPGTFKDGTSVQITMARFESVGHAGAYGPVFQISVPAPHLFRQLPMLTLQVPDLGANQSFLSVVALGKLDPTKQPADQLWVKIDSSLSSDQKTVSGPLTDFENFTVLQFAVVISCPFIGCPAGQACSGSTCQQCSTLTGCP
jgi:hypothetical protein